MKVRVSKNIKGEITIPCMKKSFSGGTAIEMSREEFLDSHTQWAIRNKMLEIIDGPTNSNPAGKDFRSLMTSALSIPCVGRAVNPGEIFFVKEDDIHDHHLNTALALGYVISEEDYRSDRDKAENDTKTSNAAKKAAANETTANKPTANKPTAKKPTAKKLAAKKAAAKKLAAKKAAANETVVKTKIRTAEDAKEDMATPDGMHIHIPEGSDAKPPVRVPRSNEVILDLDLDGPEDTVSFVDQEQKEESESRFNNLAADNEEII